MDFVHAYVQRLLRTLRPCETETSVIVRPPPGGLQCGMLQLVGNAALGRCHTVHATNLLQDTVCHAGMAVAQLVGPRASPAPALLCHSTAEFALDLRTG
jgi:hypothetical protein